MLLAELLDSMTKHNQECFEQAIATARAKAFEAGYTQGHNDTVENCVRDYREAALEYILADKQEGSCQHPNKFTYDSGPVVGAIFCPDCMCWLNHDGSVFMKADKQEGKNG